MLHLLLMTATLDAQTVHSTRMTWWVNLYDGIMSWSAGSDRMVTGMISIHNNHREDRVWKFYHGSASGVQCRSHYWTSYNDWDGTLNVRCSANYAISGFQSHHDNHREDRRWRIQCCKVANVHLRDVGLTNWVNDYDGKLDYKCGSNEVLTGLYSVHNNHREDRVWKFRCARLVPIPKLSISSSWSNYENDYDRHMHFTAGANRMITGLYSHHNNHREDRRWKFSSGYARGVTCQPQSWSGWKNSWDGVLNLDCPANQVLYGVESYHDNGREDRRWKFQCCRVSSNVSLQRKGITGYLNNWDGVLRWWCPQADEAIVSLYSYHDNHREDRRWRARCAQLSKK